MIHVALFSNQKQNKTKENVGHYNFYFANFNRNESEFLLMESILYSHGKKTNWQIWILEYNGSIEAKRKTYLCHHKCVKIIKSFVWLYCSWFFVGDCGTHIHTLDEL